MAKYEKGISVKDISRERIGILFSLAEENKENAARSARYVEHARAISAKQRVRLTQNQKRSFGRSCGAYFVPGKNLMVRISRGRVIYTCKECGRVYRIPIGKRQEL